MAIGIDKVVEDIIDSMQDRKNFVENIVKETHDLCNNFSQERKDMAKDQKS